jgi:hypothetical protein
VRNADIWIVVAPIDVEQEPEEVLRQIDLLADRVASGFVTQTAA